MWTILLAGCSTMALVAAPAAVAQAGSITATGSSQSVVHPGDRNNNASIVKAYDAARHAAFGGVLTQAHEYAVEYAKAVGLKPGSVLSVSDAQNNVYYGPGRHLGPFGPNQSCGTLRQPIFKKGENGRRKVVGTKKGPPAHVPRFATVSLTVTYSAS
jgi:hypothetical protein